MSYYTMGFNHYIGYSFPVSVTEGLDGLTNKEAGEFYKIIFIKSGSCHFVMNDREFILTGASTICMNENDKIKFYKINTDAVRILWFQPQVINSIFSLELMKNQGRKFIISVRARQSYVLTVNALRADGRKKPPTESRTAMQTGSVLRIPCIHRSSEKLLNRRILIGARSTAPCRSNPQRASGSSRPVST